MLIRAQIEHIGRTVDRIEKVDQGTSNSSVGRSCCSGHVGGMPAAIKVQDVYMVIHAQIEHVRCCVNCVKKVGQGASDGGVGRSCSSGHVGGMPVAIKRQDVYALICA